MASSTTTTFESFQKSPDWVALGKFITNTTVAPALPFSPKAVLSLARAQAKAQREGRSLSSQSSAALSSEARALMNRISALAALGGPNPLPTGTWKPKVGAKAGSLEFEQVSSNPTDGVKFEAMDSGKKFILETTWNVGGKATQNVKLSAGDLSFTQELPTALKTTLSIDSKVVLELTANVDYGTCLSKLGPVGLDLTLQPEFLEEAVNRGHVIVILML